MTSHITRRDFLKLTGLGVGAMALAPLRRIQMVDFPKGDQLGRTVSVVDVHSQPNINSPVTMQLNADSVVEWNRSVVANTLDPNQFDNQRWVETPNGFIFSRDVQPVKNLPNAPMNVLPAGEVGFWAEVTIPYVDLYIDNPPIRSPWAKTMIDQLGTPRLYYSQVVWIDSIRANPTTGVIEYRFNEDAPHGYGYGDMFWADASAFRPIADEDVAPISSNVDPAEKKIIVNITYQTLSCFEGNKEVFFCRTSTGLLASQLASGTDQYETPVGDMYTYWKIYSKAMGANSTTNAAGYDTPAVPWCTFIATGGVAIHGAFWHNGFGTPRSHGCVNVRPEDAKWIFRWTDPFVSLQQTEVRLTWPTVGTKVTSIKKLY